MSDLECCGQKSGQVPVQKTLLVLVAGARFVSQGAGRKEGEAFALEDDSVE